MKRVTRAVVAAALAAPMIASASLSLAQTPPVAQRPSQGPDLPTLLHLRPDQMAAYRAVEAADQESPAVLAQLRAKSQRVASQPLPQQLDFEAEVMNLRVAHAHRVWAAMRKFYAALTPDQQRTFDQARARPAPQGASPR